MKPPDAFPWDEVMIFGLGVLGLSAVEFWRSTPREMASAMQAHSVGAGQPADRTTFDTLMTLFPDTTNPTDGSLL